MNASFAWPTKYPLPKYRIKRVAVGSLGFLVVACSENLTSPAKPPTPPTQGSSVLAADIVVMERTTTDAADDGQVGVVHRSRKVLTPHLRKAGPDVDVRASAAAQPVALEGLPLPPLSLPARRESAMCSVLPTWSDRAKGVNGRDVLLTGAGDAPASLIKVPQADGSTWTIQRSWTRTATTWQLDKQVTTGARGYRDVVTYRHETPAGKVTSNALPSARCITPPSLVGMPTSAMSRSLYAPHPGALSAVLFPGLRETALSCDGGGSDDCYDKQLSVYRDDIAIVVTATAMAFACAPPAVILAGPCVLATTGYLAAVAALKFDVMSLQHCLEQQSKPTPVSLLTPGATGLREASVLGAAPVALTSRTPVGARTLGDCSSVTSEHCHWDVWEISYDGGETWQYFDTFLICDDAM